MQTSKEINSHFDNELARVRAQGASDLAAAMAKYDVTREQLDAYWEGTRSTPVRTPGRVYEHAVPLD